MQPYQLSNKDSRTLNKVVNSSDFKSPEDVLKYLVRNYAQELIQSQGIVIDLQPAKNGAYHTQKKWIELYNSQEGEFKGKRMISAADMFGAPEMATPEALASLQKDCIEDWIETSTHITYKPFQPKPLAGNVIHNYQSSVVNPKTIPLDEIPVLQGESAERIVKIEEGRSYLRALADDRYAKPTKLLKRLSILAQKEPEEIAFWTPDQSSRGNYRERAVRFGDSDGRFLVGGGSVFGYYFGRARGVLTSPRSGRVKK